MNNKNNPDNQKNMDEESRLIKKIKLILHKKYGYSHNRIREQVSLGSDLERRADLVVFDENKSPLIIVEIKKGNFVLPLFEYQLKELLLASKATYGLLYNGVKKRVYQLVANDLNLIKDIPKKSFFDKKFSIWEDIEKFKPITLPEVQIWHIAEMVRRDFYDYIPLLQILALKIFDESQNGKLFEKFSKHIDEQELNELWKVGSENFPNLFASHGFLEDRYLKQKIIAIFDSVKTFSLQNSDVDIITKAILKFSLHKDWSDFPKELSYFMFEILSIEKNKEILIPYCGQGFIFHIAELLVKKFNLKENRKQYLSDYLVGTEINKNAYEILKIISLLRNEPVKIINRDFLKLDSKNIPNSGYVISLPPVGAEIQNQIEVKNVFGSYGRLLINYVVLKLLEKRNTDTKAALLVPENFLFSGTSNSQLIRKQILQSSVRGIIQLPSGVLQPQTGIPMTLLILDLRESKITNNNVFLSQIPEASSKDQKLDVKILNKVLGNFKKFEKGHEFEQTSLSFILGKDKLSKSWIVSDKTPEMRKILQIPNGTKLSEIAGIFFGKPTPIELEIGKDDVKIPYLRISDIQNGLINASIPKTITIKDKRKYSNVLIQENDILLSCQGTIGKVAIAGKKDVGIVISPQIAVIRPNTKKIRPEFLVQALNSKEVQFQLRTKSLKTFILRLNKDDLQNIIVPNPPLSAQQRSATNFQRKKKRIEELEEELEQGKRDLLKFDFGE